MLKSLWDTRSRNNILHMIDILGSMRFTTSAARNWFNETLLNLCKQCEKLLYSSSNVPSSDCLMGNIVPQVI